METELNTYHYRLSESVVTDIEANSITEADALYEKLTGLKAQKATVTIDFAGKVWKDGKYQDDLSHSGDDFYNRFRS